MNETSSDQTDEPAQTNEYIKVVPSMAMHDIDDAIGFVKSLRKVRLSSFLSRIDPRRGPPTFEFLIHSEGKDAPIEFLFGCSDERTLDMIERKLRSAYPASFRFSRVEFSIEDAHLLRPEDIAPDGGLISEIEHDHQSDDVVDEADGHTLDDYARQPVDDQEEEHDPSAFDPLAFVVRVEGVGEKPKDEMTTISRYSKRDGYKDNPKRSPLSYLLEIIANAEFPITYQVLFQRRPNWSRAARRRKNNIRIGQDGKLDLIYQWIYDLLIGPSTEEKRDRFRGQTPTELGEGGGTPVDASDDITGRAQLINAKMPARTYTVNARVLAFAQDEDQVEDVRDTMAHLCTAFDHLDGYFYSVEGTVVSSILRNTASRLTNGFVASAAHREFKRMVNRAIVSSKIGKRHSHLVLNSDELANFVTVPSAKTLTAAGARATEGKLPSENPLIRPPVGELDPFREPGMEIGHAIDENGEPEEESVNIPPHLQPKHGLVAVPTGGGKSIFNINAGKSLAQNNGGPVVMIDRKGDGMCLDYMRVHLATFGHLDNVYYFRVPKVLPAIPFYDIRPRLANHGDRDPKNVREESIQDKVNHTHEILRMIMGREVYDRAFANTITSYLIHALYDEEYGSDAFGLDDLFDAAREMQTERTIPEVSPDRPNDPEGSLTRHFSKDKRQFQQSMDAVLNRLEEIKEDSFLSQVFSHVPEWNDTQKEYEGNVFDIRRFLDEDVVILFDMGDIRPEAQRVLTMVFLSHVWDAVQERKRGGQGYDKVINLIIDEAAPIAATPIVSKQLLPQARSFGLGLTLLVQYARQILNETGNEQAYEEVMNNMHTKIIGDISIDETLLNSLVHDELSPEELRNRINRLPSGEWVVQLPSPGFGEPKPPLFSLKPLDIPRGHPESDEPLSEEEEHRFLTELLPEVIDRTLRECGIRISESDLDSGWGSKGARGNGEQGEVDYFSSMFSDMASDTDSRTDGSIDDGDYPSDRPDEEDDLGMDFWLPDADSTNPDHLDDTGDGTGDESLVDDENVEDDLDPSAEPERREDESINSIDENLIPEAEVGIPDEVRDEYGLTTDDVRFLERVLNAMNGELEGYSLLDSMTPLTKDFETLDVQRLIDNGFLEEERVARRHYYTVLPAGRQLLGETLSIGPGTGDLGEKTPHKAGVEILSAWLEQQHTVSHVQKYYAYDDETVFDVAGFDETDELVWVGEVELQSENKAAPVADYDKMSDVEADVIWAFKNRKEGVGILDVLAEADRMESITGRDRKSNASVRSGVEDQQLPGMTTIRTLPELGSELNR